MFTMFIDFAFAIAMAGAGFSAAWFLKRTAPAAEPVEDRAEVAETAIARLHELARRISADVTDHNSRVQEINDGLTDGSEITAENLTSAVTTLITVNERMQEQLVSAEKRLQDQAREIECHAAEARTDALTNLANRRVFDSEMERGVAEYHRRGRPMSVMIIDVDHFKQFNDTHGHQAGDEVLRAVGQVLTKNTLPEHVVCRYGGEEFAIVFPGATMTDAAPVAEAARKAIAEHAVAFEGKKLKVTASAGVAQLLPQERVDDLVRRADEALYASKEEGRNRGHGHNGETFFPITDLLKPSTPPAPVEVQTVEPPAPVAEAKAEPKAETKSRFDPLTGLSTMESFRDDVVRRLAEVKRSRAPLSILVARIDKYEDIVAQFGDRNASMVLRAAAQFFKAAMRDMDHLARDDDDSFVLLLPTASLDNAKKVADRLRGAICRCKLPVGGTPFQFTMSFGVAETIPGECHESLIQRCKAAQCQAVQSGGNQCHADKLDLEPAAR